MATIEVGHDGMCLVVVGPEPGLTRILKRRNSWQTAQVFVAWEITKLQSSKRQSAPHPQILNFTRLDDEIWSFFGV
jgi:hypothetical protein